MRNSSGLLLAALLLSAAALGCRLGGASAKQALADDVPASVLVEAYAQPLTGCDMPTWNAQVVHLGERFTVTMCGEDGATAIVQHGKVVNGVQRPERIFNVLFSRATARANNRSLAQRILAQQGNGVEARVRDVPVGAVRGLFRGGTNPEAVQIVSVGADGREYLSDPICPYIGADNPDVLLLEQLALEAEPDLSA